MINNIDFLTVVTKRSVVKYKSMDLVIQFKLINIETRIMEDEEDKNESPFELF